MITKVWFNTSYSNKRTLLPNTYFRPTNTEALTSYHYKVTIGHLVVGKVNCDAYGSALSNAVEGKGKFYSKAIRGV